METIDAIKSIMADADRVVGQLSEIENAVRSLHCRMISLPGETESTEKQAEAIRAATTGLRLWRQDNMDALKKAFE